MHCLTRISHNQQPLLHQLREGGPYARLRVTGKMSNGFLGSSPLVKEIENFASNRSSRDSQSPREIVKKKPAVTPVSEQASSPSQLDSSSHSVRLMQICLQEEPSIGLIDRTPYRASPQKAQARASPHLQSIFDRRIEAVHPQKSPNVGPPNGCPPSICLNFTRSSASFLCAL